MKMKSYFYLDGHLQPVEIEVLSQKGLPLIQFVGLPDQVIKESAIRIKSAIKSCGFEWPQSKQIIVSLKPAHLKKTSQGLEFAVAAAILHESCQIELSDEILKNYHFYGTLDLEGNVHVPEDLQVFYPKNPDSEFLFTGTPDTNHFFYSHNRFMQVQTLKDLTAPNSVEAMKAPWVFQRPTDFDHIYLSQGQKELALICALGGHHTLLAGAAGSGKSLLVDVIHSLKTTPSYQEEGSIVQRHLQNNHPLCELWRPLIKPHHSITLQGLIGGGLKLNEGELSRAHFGTMIFDELLEFKQQVVESLREPLETGHLRIARTSGYVVFESQFQWLATTNLCPCGDYVPGKNIDCRYALSKCKSYSQRLSGPLLDRFEMISFSNEWKGDRNFRVSDLAEALRENSFFNRERVSLSGKEVLTLESKLPFVSQKIFSDWSSSNRRKNATLQVAYTLARLNERDKILDEDIERALDYTLRPFQRIQRWN